ncbi:MAG: hypothetical protein H7Z14_18205, partial [Anaerolineae bacterium]|nr:hypothetical protein [Phycisphaerae bacterium]
QPCGSCGYNLRGLPPGVGCPECGSRFGWNVGEEPIPWEEDENAPLSFFRTAFMAIARSHDLAKNVRRPYRLDLAAAKRFRRIAMLIAIPPLCMIVWMITATATSPTIAWWSLPMDAVAITVWLNMMVDSAGFYFRDKVSARVLPRVQTLIHYTTAPLLLVPLHLAALMVTLRAPINGSAVNCSLAIAQHLALLLATISIGAPLFAWLLFESVSITALGAFTIAFARMIAFAGMAVVLLVAVPAMMALIVYRLVS